MSVTWQKLPLYYERKLTTNYPVVQAIYLLFLWYLFKSSCIHVGQCLFVILVLNRDQSMHNRPLSRGGHFESQGNKKLCFCPSSLALDERLDGQNLLFQHCVIKVYWKNWFPWILIHNRCCNQELWNEKRQPLFICCLYNVALSMLDELAFMNGISFQYQLFNFMFWKYLLQIISISGCLI